jgi:hypothetical protein
LVRRPRLRSDTGLPDNIHKTLTTSLVYIVELHAEEVIVVVRVGLFVVESMTQDIHPSSRPPKQCETVVRQVESVRRKRFAWIEMSNGVSKSVERKRKKNYEFFFLFLV